MASNFNAFADFAEADLRGMIADLPASLQYEGQTIACGTDDLSQDWQIRDVVENRKRGIKLTAVLADFALAPIPEQPIEVRQMGESTYASYWIEEVTVSADGKGVVLTLRANQD